MKLSAILTTLALTLTSTVALAAPNEQSFRRPGMSDHRRPVREQWTALAASSVRHGRQVIQVSSQQRFRKLKIEATRGPTKIDTVLITFANGRTQIVELDQRIGMNTAAATIDLQGEARQISKIVITTKGNSRSSFSVLAA